jgi:hypothetical protein
LWGNVPAASAGAEWCSSDPPVVIHTPGGDVVPLHVTNYGEGREHLAAVRKASIETQVEAANSGTGTEVTIVVLIPDDAGQGTFRTRSVVSTRPNAAGTVLATDSGRSGEAMVLQFTLDVS